MMSALRGGGVGGVVKKPTKQVGGCVEMRPREEFAKAMLMSFKDGPFSS